MEALLSRPLAVAVTLALLAVALLGVQAAAVTTAPAQPMTDAGRVLGDAGFAYLGGLRVFAAAVLWNRLEPQFDQFYASKRLEDLTFLTPNLYLIQRLDPNFVQAYYNAAFILGRREQWAEAYRVAEDGVRYNPQSGLMRANYVQLLLMQDREANLDKAYRQALAGVRSDVQYDSIDDEFESLAVFRGVFRLAGRSDVVAAIEQRQAQLKALGAEATGLSHDHDGDGQPDH